MFKTANKDKDTSLIDITTYCIYLQNIAIVEALKGTGITKQDIKYLTVAHILFIKNGHFEIKGIENALRAKCDSDIRQSCVRLMALGYVERIAGRKFGSKIGRKYITTGKTDHLVKNYNKIMRRLLNEVNQ